MATLGSATYELNVDSTRFTSGLDAAQRRSSVTLGRMDASVTKTGGFVTMLSQRLGDAGREAMKAATGMMALGKGADSASDQVDELNRSLAKADLLRSGSLFGGPPGRGIATDVGSMFAKMQNAATGVLSALLLIVPTVNVIIAGLVGVLSLLTASAIAAVGFAAAFAGVGAAMLLTAAKWRDLIEMQTDGVDHFRGAILAMEAAAFEGFNRVRAAVQRVGAGNIWDSLATATIKGIDLMTPYITKFVARLQNFIDAINGVGGASSPFLDWMEKWVREWSVLSDIANEGLPEGGGFFGFLEKYRKPAEAFVEGIAQVINGIRKMSAMGLGLNMDQLSGFINNVFTALARVVQYFPRFSNALVMVGLQVSKFLVDISPMVEQMFIIGEAILKNFVAPLVNVLLKALKSVMDIPFIGWLLTVVGGLALVAVALSKLSFGLLTTGGLMKGLGNGFVWLSKTVGAAVASMLGVTATMGAFATVVTGAIVVVAAIGLAFLALRGPMSDVAELNKTLADSAKQAWADMVSGAQSGSQALVGVYDNLKEHYDKMSLLSRVMYSVTHISDFVSSRFNVNAMLQKQSADALAESYKKAGEALREAVSIGQPLTEQMVSEWKALQARAGQGLTMPVKTVVDSKIPFTNIAWTTHTPAGYDQLLAAYEDQQNASEEVKQSLKAVDWAYKTNAINAGQYATYLEVLSGGYNSAGKAVDLMALKMKGATNTIAQALLQVDEVADAGGKRLEHYAEASGQSFVALRQEALDALNDTAGGMLGTGEKVREFLQKQKDAITEWRESFAENINLVAQSWSTLGQQTSVSATQIVNTLREAVQKMETMRANMREVIKRGLSDEAIQQITSLAADQQAVIWAGLASGTKKNIQDTNKWVAKGGDLADSMASTVAKALGNTFKELTTAIEWMVATQLGLSFEEVQSKVRNLVNSTNNETAQLRDRIVTVKVREEWVGGRVRPKFGESEGGGATGPLAGFTLPGPDTKKVASDWSSVGKLAVDSFGMGLNSNAHLVEAPAADVASAAINGTRQRLGAASPSKEFQAIGQDCIAGLVGGLDSAVVFTKFFAVGMSMVQGLQAGASTQMLLFRLWWSLQLQGIVQMARDAFQSFSPSRVFYDIGLNIGEGMRLGLSTGFRRVHEDMRKHLDFPEPVVNRGASVVGRGASGRFYSFAGNGPEVVGSRQAGSTLHGRMRIENWETGIAFFDGRVDDALEAENRYEDSLARKP